MRNIFILWVSLIGVERAVAADAANFELVYSTPAETSLQNADLRSPDVVWCEMFAAAKKRIDLAEMYISTDPQGPELNRVLDCLRAAGQRGVKIRFFIEKKMLAATNAEGRARVEAIPNLKLEVVEWSRINGDGIVHAKYILVDGKDAFLGSQNFDWRALRHIHETGVRIRERRMVRQLQNIFDHDWRAWQWVKRGWKAQALQIEKPQAPFTESVYLVASPWRFNPHGVGDSEQELARLIGEAKESVQVVVMDYYPLDFHRQFYAVIDNALRAAATRGVKVQLIASNWCAEPGKVEHIKSLGLIPNIEIKISTLPQSAEGFIAFARVVHSKFMIVDSKTAWLGTSNWTGGYLDSSRNLELVMRDLGFAARLKDLHQQLWNSPYVAPLQIDKDYQPVKKF